MDENKLEKRKRVILDLLADPMYKPMKLKELAIFLDIPKESRRELKEVLDCLLEEGLVSISTKGKFTLPKILHYVGIYLANARGFGFVQIEGREEDIFIPEGCAMDALHGDKVRIVVDQQIRGMRAEGHVVEILDHANKTVVGFYRKNKKFGFVLPDNQKILSDIFIPDGQDMGAVSGHKVVVEVTHFFEGKRRKPEGRIIEILGHANDPGVDILSIVKMLHLPEQFSEEVMEEVANIPEEVTEKEKRTRLDLRDKMTVTIDGEDAKDLDDAITLERDGENWRLGVHIADVSHYVRENTALDREAFARGTSIYLVDRVIPMLPHRLSNGICSLNEGVDRLALSCIMDINHRGEIIGHQIAETLIRVNHRMSYTEVNAMITHHDQDTIEKYTECVEMFENMKELADLIRKKRVERGSIDFDFPECKILLDEKGSPIEIKAYERNAANMLIEDFMLAANETVAEEYYWLELPFLYRVHDTPDPEKIQQLATFIQNFGYTLHAKNKEVHPKEVQKLLAKIAGEEVEMMISRVTLRSMKQARYQTECTGHFGLAAKYYTHFTSPIRRYPDLQIHRIIKENLAGKLNQSRQKHYSEHLEEVAVQTSVLERRAQEAERETIKYKKCEYMQKYIGQVFDGIICGVTRYGLYVELPNTVEGLVHIQAMWQDYFVYVEERHMLIGETTNIKYTLGQRVKVRVMAVDRLMGTIDFRLEMEGEEDEWLME
jgi:ribonuclease R